MNCFLFWLGVTLNWLATIVMLLTAGVILKRIKEHREFVKGFNDDLQNLIKKALEWATINPHYT